MNNFWNFKLDLKIVLVSFLIVLSLPIIAVIILTQTGINLISDKLVDQTGIENQVEILDPVTGEVAYTINQPMFWPTEGVATLEFGVPHLPYQILHTGIDIANSRGTYITPFMNGRVIYAAETKTGYGKHIIIEHGSKITSLYGHLDKILVYKGQEVTGDEVIGLMGNTGWSTGNHLHFQINVYGIPVNPRSFLKI